MHYLLVGLALVGYIGFALWIRNARAGNFSGLWWLAVAFIALFADIALGAK